MAPANFLEGMNAAAAAAAGAAAAAAAPAACSSAGAGAAGPGVAAGEAGRPRRYEGRPRPLHGRAGWRAPHPGAAKHITPDGGHPRAQAPRGAGERRGAAGDALHRVPPLRAAALVALLFVVAATSEAFQTQLTTLSKAAHFRSVDATGCLHRSTGYGWSRLAAATESVDGDIDTFLSENYPDTKGLIDSNDEVAKKLREASESGYTIFAPTTTSFKNLGDKKISQLDDPCNLEVREKIAAYHAIAEPVTAEELFNAGGVITLGGEIPTFLVGGGLFGFMGGGDKGDGTVTINGAKLLRSFTIGNSVVHEVDALVSPKILWRYADQNRNAQLIADTHCQKAIKAGINCLLLGLRISVPVDHFVGKALTATTHCITNTGRADTDARGLNRIEIGHVTSQVDAV